MNIRRDHYRIFSEGRIGPLPVPNRLVRSAAWDPMILHRKAVTAEVLRIYQQLAEGGVGLIISGGITVLRESLPESGEPPGLVYGFPDLRVEGIGEIAGVVHAHGNGCKIVAQLEAGCLNAGPSDYPSPFRRGPLRELTIDEIGSAVDAFTEAAIAMKEAGFDGIQLHAAHGGFLSTFLSPHTNRRSDQYGGSMQNRVRIVAEIVSRVRKELGNFPILIKMNGTDYIPGGIDALSFPQVAAEVVKVGVDAIEVSGGILDCLVRPESELGFRPVPSPESHTRIWKASQQSYFLPYAASLDVDIPLILVGGNRDVESLEEILKSGAVDFIAMCRPFLREPDLARRWLEGRGNSSAACVSCNSCLYDMFLHPGRKEPGPVRCVFNRRRKIHHLAQKWLAGWVEDNLQN